MSGLVLELEEVGLTLGRLVMERSIGVAMEEKIPKTENNKAKARETHREM
jgi:hypothetical protein